MFTQLHFQFIAHNYRLNMKFFQVENFYIYSLVLYMALIEFSHFPDFHCLSIGDIVVGFATLIINNDYAVYCSA